MRASTDQVRDLTLDVVDGARRRAAGAVTHGAEQVVSTLDGAVSTVGGGVDRLAERAPSVSLAVERPARRHRARIVLIGVAVLVTVLAVARKLLGDRAAGTDEVPAHDHSGHDDSGQPNQAETEDNEAAAG
jgi:hypothetical protein